MAELKPCPFCGRSPIIEQFREEVWFVECDHDPCGVQPVTDCFEKKEEAISAWNRREQNAKLVEALKAAFHALRSYQYGNSATELAEEMADTCEKLLREAGEL